MQGFRLIVLLFLSMFVSVANAYQVHYMKHVEVVHSPDTRACTFFRLVDLAEADPVVPGNPWFSLPQSHIGYKDALSLLIAGYTAGKPVTVETTGNAVCGHAEVIKVMLGKPW